VKIQTPLLIILGPTASGKSDVAVKLAKQLNGEVVSADSRQVYRGLDIGTGKITKKEMKGVQHHLLDVADLSANTSSRNQFSVVKYVELAKQAIENIAAKGKLPIICGGTGFYIQALVDGIILPDVPANNELRKKLSKKSVPELLAQLKKLDPKRYNTIERKNIRRIIRAIEIATVLGKVPALKKQRNNYLPIFIGMNVPPAELRKRIHARLLKRIKAGMVGEAKRLHAKKPRGQNISWKRMNELGLEYRHLALHLQGKLTREEMITKLETEIWHYAKRQLTWFRRDKRIHWFSPKDVDRMELHYYNGVKQYGKSSKNRKDL